MPRPRPARARLDNLNHKGGHAERIPPPNQNRCDAEGSKAGMIPIQMNVHICIFRLKLTHIKRGSVRENMGLSPMWTFGERKGFEP
eukprot:10827657-Ditylum_brightwellii.AAC.1